VAEGAGAFNEHLGEFGKEGHGDHGKEGHDQALGAKGQTGCVQQLWPEEIIQQVVEGDGPTWCGGSRAGWGGFWGVQRASC
jgi:hypothetical protein